MGSEGPTPPSLSTPSPHIIKAFARPRAALILLPHLPGLSVPVHGGGGVLPAAIPMTRPGSILRAGPVPLIPGRTRV